MENNLIERINLPKEDETISNVIQFPNNITDNRNIIDDENEKIIIYVPKGYSAKVILEKKDEISTDTEYQYSPSNVHKIDSKILTNTIKNELAMTSVCDIIKPQTGYNYTSDFKERYDIGKEEADMKLSKTKELNKIHIEFLVVSFITIIFSLIGLLIFSMNGFYIIHPSIYILGFFMGLGWLATAATSIYKHRR
ncbi:hypothetical protein [Clostridium diolis]|uniref:DUF2335 domain-containing protein n=1 Tax=Clostridium diolis TaxID=223919 RepID=A0AAV3W855_9CLOT|nr:hypothetical protein [Clostridium diolis]QES71618.1 hypothetical protein F3K33_01795 [Clostridium diolis]GEA33627.1 hypothetical protein CDIOL_45500 [Clostridium diolis]